MFKYKITIVLKSGYEIRARAKDYSVFDVGLVKIQMESFNLKIYCIDNKEIAAVIVEHWYQRWA